MTARSKNLGPGYVHPKAATTPDSGEHDWALEMAADASKNYLQWIAEICEPHLGDSVLELGAGWGSVTQHLAQGRHLLATDLSDACVAALRERFADVPNVRVSQEDLRTASVDETFDSIVLINTLEHIGDDAGALASMRRFLKPDGRLLIYVPAFNWLYSDYDRKVGHFRRYDKPLLTSVLDAAGYDPVELKYVNLLAMPAWLVVSVWLHRDATETSGSLDIWDRTGTPATKWIESKVRIPFGLNLFAAARPR